MNTINKYIVATVVAGFTIIVGFLLTSESLFVPLLITYISLAMAVHLVVLQAIETVTIKDYLVQYRYLLLALLTIILVTIIPGAIYLTYRTLGIENEGLRQLATFCGRFGLLAFMTVMEATWAYARRKR